MPATPPRAEPDEIAAAALRRAPRLGSCRLVSVDGPAGSGKTTLAAALAERLGLLGARVEVLHMDDFYEGWDGLSADLEPRLLGQVIEPLAAGRPGRWQRYDWHLGRFDDWHDLPVADVLVLEGCGSGARAYSPWRSLLVWVEAAPATRLARGIARDGPDVEPAWRAWMRREDAHFAAEGTRGRADLAQWTDER